MESLWLLAELLGLPHRSRSRTRSLRIVRRAGFALGVAIVAMTVVATFMIRG